MEFINFPIVALGAALVCLIGVTIYAITQRGSLRSRDEQLVVARAQAYAMLELSQAGVLFLDREHKLMGEASAAAPELLGHTCGAGTAFVQAIAELVDVKVRREAVAYLESLWQADADRDGRRHAESAGSACTPVRATSPSASRAWWSTDACITSSCRSSAFPRRASCRTPSKCRCSTRKPSPSAWRARPARVRRSLLDAAAASRQPGNRRGSSSRAAARRRAAMRDRTLPAAPEPPPVGQLAPRSDTASTAIDPRARRARTTPCRRADSVPPARQPPMPSLLDSAGGHESEPATGSSLSMPPGRGRRPRATWPMPRKPRSSWRPRSRRTETARGRVAARAQSGSGLDHRSARCAPVGSAQGNHARRGRAARDVPRRGARQGRPAARHHQTTGARAAGLPREAGADPRADPRHSRARQAAAAAVGVRARRTLRRGAQQAARQADAVRQRFPAASP